MALLAFLVLAGQIHAQVLRWTARGDVQSMDPHAFSESVTFNLNSLVYDALVERDGNGNFIPALADSWVRVAPAVWRFHLRSGVRFHDGSALSSDDVVFSILRAQQPSSQFSSDATLLGEPFVADDQTILLRQSRPNPVLLQHLSRILIMSRSWTTARNAERVPQFKNREEAATSRTAMGTGRFMLEERQPGFRTRFIRNPRWWGEFKGNIAQIVFSPIANDASRIAAMLSGGVDLMQDVPPQNIRRIGTEPGVATLSVEEDRLIFLAFDQWRDHLLYSDLPARNPFKDIRVREAIYRAIDVERLAASVLQGQARPTGCLASSSRGCYARALQEHPPADVALARRLMAAAGFARGFDLTLDCPNDRYVNDQAVCEALAAMLSRIGIRLTVDARPKSTFFPKVQSSDSSFWMLGWGGTDTDPQSLLENFLHSQDPVARKGNANYGKVGDAELDQRIDAASAAADLPTRERLIREAQTLASKRYYYLPLYRQVVVWAVRAGVHAVVTSDNIVRPDRIRID